jgi:hypothetical protein
MDHGQAHGPLWTSSSMGPLGHGSALTRAHRWGGAKERGERGEPISGLIIARAVVWRPGDGDEAAAVMELSGGGARP